MASSFHLSFHLRQKYYPQITWKLTESVRAIDNKWENWHRLEVAGKL